MYNLSAIISNVKTKELIFISEKDFKYSVPFFCNLQNLEFVPAMLREIIPLIYEQTYY